MVAATVFETHLADIFVAAEEKLAARLAREKAKAETLQAETTSRLAYVFAEAIEHELEPSVDRALATYDAAIERPIQPNPRFEDALCERIGHAVDVATRLAAGTAAVGPWKPLLTAEAPAIRARLLARANAHFVELGRARKAAARAANRWMELSIRIGLFLGGVLAGGLIAGLFAG
jgi:hypothetical protein